MSGVRTLRVAFESPQAFQREFDCNLANGGVFVRTEDAFELREPVEVELFFDYSGESIQLAAEVVHIVPPEMAQVGGKAGVAVQFQLPVQQLREKLGAVAAASAASADRRDGGKRGARRKPVHVNATLKGRKHVVAGRTRNLSLTGALVEAQGHAFAMGDPVELLIEHPTSGEQRSIRGRVVRRIESEGEVSALAIEFAPVEDREAIERFVEDLQRIEHTRRLGGISGPIEELGPFSLLQMFTTSAPRGTLVLRCDQEEGVICFDGGLLRLARLGATTGMKALVRMLSWKDGVFEFHGRIDETIGSEPPFPLEAALLDAVRQIDEGTTVDAHRFPLGAVISRNRAGDLGAFGEPTKVESALLDLAAAGFTVQRALEVIPEPDPEIFRALQALVEAELVSVDD